MQSLLSPWSRWHDRRHCSRAGAELSTHPITMIVPYPAGGPSDVVARIMADGMSKVLGQNIVIENVGGAGGTIGTARAALSEHDGYTCSLPAWDLTSRPQRFTPI